MASSLALMDNYMNLAEPQLQKQMAAINNMSVRRASASMAGGSGTSSVLGGSNGTTHDQSLSMNPQHPSSLKQRQYGFLNGLARIMVGRNTPLPPALTGVDTPSYDPANTQWKILEPAEVGAFRLAGRDIELFKLWGIVFQAGGGPVLSRENLWHTILPHFDLPEDYNLPNGTSVAQMLAQYYMAILGPFEEFYRQNIQNQQRKAQAASRQGPGQPMPPSTPTRSDGASPQRPNEGNGPSPDGEPGIKRKLESEEADVKRARLKTEPEATAATNGTDQASSSAPPSMPRQRPSRRKIEYVPLGREIDTVGGRDMKLVEAETIAKPLSRALRDINDWGVVAVDALTLSLRSQIATELSYALTTFTLLSTMRGDTVTSGFPIVQCPDLFEELLDLLEERAFDGAEDSSDPSSADTATYRELVNTLLEVESQPFVVLEPQQGAKDPALGPRPRPGNIIMSIVNILRNLSFVPDNSGFLSQQDRMLDLMLRLCCVTTKHGKPAAVSASLSLGDIITIRRETLHTLMHLAGFLHFPDPPSKIAHRIATRAFHLISSFLVDPIEAVSPFACFQLAGANPNNPKPPFLADVALETFTRLVQSDMNRKAFSRVIPEASIRLLFTSCVHRLPVIEPDFQLVVRDRWLSYMEKVIMTIYSLVFLATPELKKKIKMDRRLSFKGVVLRMIQKFLVHTNHELKAQFSISARRAVEAMKLLDDCEDSFETSEAAPATLSFGMGFGEVGDSGMEKGTGLLGGDRELTWDLLMLREVYADNVLFGELESLSRVE
ncbi:hypothetical protein FB45DRAFT_916453 [Roridomyces roridus]|uniref:ARID domain-containing protein n=1 Tax=Roridomyces roridus TaxID=1738132 RepID=A0AAD7BU06_9AGAR|nr:hypothetical protein FB45DRAFT_916453 [Roridomyces roridus]